MRGSWHRHEQRAFAGAQLPILVLLAGPFYLNDFASIFVSDWRLWLGIDYIGVKLFPLLVVWWSIRANAMQATEFGLTKQAPRSFLVAFVLAAIVGTIIDQNGHSLLAGLPGYAPLGAMPPIDNPIWNWIDLTLGLLVVGIVEELVFRGYMHAVLSRFTRRRLVIVAVSGVAFGLIHWSLGLHTVVITSLIGAVFMCVYLHTRALPGVMLAHFAVNFIDFSGVVPKSVFKLAGP
jgi:membrane protease YdiL (CAAX protease family)